MGKVNSSLSSPNGSEGLVEGGRIGGAGILLPVMLEKRLEREESGVAEPLLG
jgi:hypothetical protein